MNTLYLDEEGLKSHESLLRAFNILAKVKYLLEIDTPASVVLEMIEVMETARSFAFPKAGNS